ncbi:MAG: response regulator [Ectothiorhodospiraceae bacterium]|nr:response regulator [Ectothiorhodospiraceae bacterium]
MEILLVEDSVGDVRLTQEGLKEAKIRNNLSVCKDGIEALDFLRQKNGFEKSPRPDLILLDLNMPRMGGQECLEIIKQDPTLATIPVVVLTTSQSERDIMGSYQHHANCYITKPVDFEQFMKVVQSIGDFWLTVVKLPSTA